MGFYTLSRNRAQRAQGTTTAQQRTSVPIEEHQLELQKQRKAYEIRLSRIAAERPAPKGKAKELQAQLKALQAELQKIGTEHEALKQRVVERGKELGLNDDEVLALLNDDAPVPPLPAEPDGSGSDASNEEAGSEPPVSHRDIKPEIEQPPEAKSKGGAKGK